MDTIKKIKLQIFREKIVEDLDVEHIVDGLITTGIIDDAERESIFQEGSRRDRVRHLLDLLPSKGPTAFDNFVGSLMRDYPWLYAQLKGEIDPSLEEEKFLDALLLGGIPRMPPHNVERRQTLKELRSSLEFLTRGQYIVLHGMTGSGKSCLAAAAVDCLSLVSKSFKNCIFWLSVGDSGSDVLSHMNRLMYKLESTGKYPDAFQKQDLMNLTWFHETLKKFYTNPDLRDGLLVLDDVASSDVIEAFDIGCKILVTTKDLEVMKNVKGRIYKTIMLNGGFEERETLSLFAKCTNQNIDELPYQAKEIHRLCKGVPMLIALIGANLEEHSEDARLNKGRWNYFIKKLSAKDYSSPGNSHFYRDELLTAVGMSVNNLPNDQKQRFQEFALFKEDVNIKPEVLQVLWSLNKYEVEDIMLYFVKKSLAVSKWNEELNSSVYGIHDIILDYLKFNLTKEKKIELHRKFLDAYSKICNGDFSKLPNDNYIYTYIGYHIDEAEMWEMYDSLYTNLNFLQAKIKVTGPGDLLLDYKKYRKHIDKDQDHLGIIVNEFETFVHIHGLDLYKYQDLDIIQCALKEPRGSFLFEKAYQVAKDCKTSLYLEYILDQDNCPDSHSLLVDCEALAVCFTHDEQKILVGCADGSINLWAVDYKRIIHKFQGHMSEITTLQHSLSSKMFLSSSKDGTVKLWTLENLVDQNPEEQEAGQGDGAVRTPSPRLRQNNWSNMFSHSGSDDKSIFTFRKHTATVNCASFAHNKSEVVSCAMDGSVKVWNYETGMEKLHIDVISQTTVRSCTFSTDDTLIYFGGSDSKVYIYSADCGTFLSGLNNKAPILTLTCIPDVKNEVFVLTENTIEWWSWGNVNTSCPVNNVIIHEEMTATLALEDLQTQVLGKTNGTKFLCGAITEDGNYFLTASTNHTICIWDVQENKSHIIKEYQEHSGIIHCLSTNNNGSAIKIVSGGSKSVRVWRYDAFVSETTTVLQSTFDALWDKGNSESHLPLFAVTDNTNKVQILYGRELVCESPREQTKITCCKLGSKNTLIYGCANGIVKLFEVQNRRSLEIMKFNKPVLYLDVFDIQNETIVAASDQTDLKLWHPPCQVCLCYGIKTLVVKCFLLCNKKRILSCCNDGSLKVSKSDTGALEEVIVGQIRNATIVAAHLCAEQETLVLADRNNSFHMIWLANNEREMYSETVQRKSPINCCCFSPDGQFVALGQENGIILIWNVLHSNVHAELHHHRSCVKDIVFARNVLDATILVSVAETVAWWGIEPMKERRTSRVRRRQSQHSPIQSPDFAVHGALAPVWSSKLQQAVNHQLLGCLKLAGSHAVHIVCSPDFNLFTTVDSAGFIYVLRVIS